MQLNDPNLFKQQGYIQGKWLEAFSKKSFSVFNPSKNTCIGTAPQMEAQEAKLAIEAAYQAFPIWREKTAKERSQILRRWYDLILENLADLATILTIEQGKPLQEAQAEILYGASFVEWFSEEAKRAYGDIIPSVKNKQHLFVIKQPIGVVAAITPWNFPNAMITRKCAPALAAGCTVVLKPAELTPFSAFALAELAERAGIPPGVLNIITGDPVAIGLELTQNPKVRKLTFTGSTQVGKQLMVQSAPTVKKLSLELGGSAPFLVFSDAEIDTAVEGLIASKFRNSGQTCVCADRILVEEAIYSRFLNALAEKIKALKVGDGLEEGVEQGPLIEVKAVQKVERQIQEALSQGASLLCGGKKHPLGGAFFEPTLLADVTPSMEVMKEETFGPVAAVARFRTEEEAIQLANDTPYGLASYLYSQNMNRLLRVAEQLEFGIVSINGGLFSNEVTPFGGVKESGIGREGSKYGIEEFLQIKYLCLQS